MKYLILTFLLSFSLSAGSFAQHMGTIDYEVAMVPMVDSISQDSMIPIWVMINANNNIRKYFDYGLGGNYQVQGTLVPPRHLGRRLNGGCLNQNRAENQQVSGTTLTVSANTVNSLAVAVTSGSVTITANGSSVTYSSGQTVQWTAPNPCEYLTNTITIDATSGTALVATIK